MKEKVDDFLNLFQSRAQSYQHQNPEKVCLCYRVNGIFQKTTMFLVAFGSLVVTWSSIPMPNFELLANGVFLEFFVGRFELGNHIGFPENKKR